MYTGKSIDRLIRNEIIKSETTSIIGTIMYNFHAHLLIKLLAFFNQVNLNFINFLTTTTTSLVSLFMCCWFYWTCRATSIAGIINGSWVYEESRRKTYVQSIMALQNRKTILTVNFLDENIDDFRRHSLNQLMNQEDLFVCIGNRFSKVVPWTTVNIFFWEIFCFLQF